MILVPQAYYALKLDSFTMDYHTHSCHEIMYVITGKPQIYVADQQLTLKANQFVFIKKNVPHKLFVDPTASASILNFEFENLTSGPGLSLKNLDHYEDSIQKLLTPHTPYLLLNDSGKMGFALKDLINSLEELELTDFYITVLFQRMLIEMVRCHKKSETTSGLLYIKQAINYLRTHYQEEIRIEDVANHIELNKSYLQTLFKQHLGTNIISYLNNYRMEQAVFLLRNSNLSVTDIAFTVGYNSRQHFGHIFKLAYGMSPKNYRNLNNQFISASTGKNQIKIPPK